jgi:hypothetical protein
MENLMNSNPPTSMYDGQLAEMIRRDQQPGNHQRNDY